ncbi:hypothetical protein RJT34_31132 [Clitoria ternatea]|uniref:Uncharacterized protein n=1 Tax=Clitoria ternatea TaxID=43366 RepID=A0AAN9EVU2_CLITE
MEGGGIKTLFTSLSPSSSSSTPPLSSSPSSTTTSSNPKPSLSSTVSAIPSAKPSSPIFCDALHPPPYSSSPSLIVKPSKGLLKKKKRLLDNNNCTNGDSKDAAAMLDVSDDVVCLPLAKASVAVDLQKILVRQMVDELVREMHQTTREGGEHQPTAGEGSDQAAAGGVFMLGADWLMHFVTRLYRSSENTNQQILFDIDPFGQHLSTGDQDGLVHVYNLQTGQ